MSRITNPEALAHLEKRMVATFGVGHREYDAGTASRVVPTAHLNAAVRVTDTSGILDKVGRWDSERRKSNAGKKPIIPLRALVVLYLLNTQMGTGVSYTELARTLASRFSPEHFAAVGIRTTEGDMQHWYKRISDTTYRLIALMNPRPTPLRRILNARQFENLLQTMAEPAAKELSARNQERLDDFCNSLVEASYRHLPEDLRQKYRGNIAIDATKTPIRGPRNSASSEGSRSNPDPLAGRYTREGSHGGSGASTDQAAYELETAVMVWNKPGENSAFPSLITEISCHNPGRHVGHAAALTARHKSLGFDRFVVVVDRAYNYEKIETFHEPLVKLGVEAVFDYRAEDLGIQGHFEDLILVDGSWYVNWMPQGLIEVSRNAASTKKAVGDAQITVYKSEHPTKSKGPSEDAVQSALQTITRSAENDDALQQRLAMREPYRMVPKGRRDTDGYQRFSYPPLSKMVALPKSPPKVTSITIPPVLPESEEIASGKVSARKAKADRAANSRSKMQPLKFTQHLPHNGPEWRAFYGMRSLVESSNHRLKTPAHGDIENVKKRSGRGYAAIYLALAFAVVASNLNRIASFFVAEALGIQRASTKVRRRRRRDELGNPLPRAKHEAEPEPIA